VFKAVEVLTVLMAGMARKVFKVLEVKVVVKETKVLKVHKGCKDL
jgi:hypothetical protein